MVYRLDCGGAYGIAAVVVVDTPPWDLVLDTILVVVVVDILAVAWVNMCYYWSGDIVVVNSRTNSVLRVAMIVVVVVVDLVRNYFDGMVLVLVVVEDDKMMDSSYFRYDYNLG